MQSLQIGRKIASYTGVKLNAGKNAAGKDVVFFAGSSLGYVLEIDHPHGTKEMANRILASLACRGVQYQPFTSLKTPIDPAAEIGDGVSVSGKLATIWSLKQPHSRIMASDVSAPYDAELNHEWKYTPREVRQYKRESAYTRANLKLSKDQILSEVSRASGAESRIDQRVDSLAFSVSGANGTSVFTLTDGATTLNTTSFDITVKAMNVKGTLTATQIAAGAITLGKLAGDAKAKITASGGQIYKSVATNSVPTAPTSWVSDESGDQNKWTRIRPEYSSSYKYLFTAYQRLDADDVYTCTTPKRDKTTTVIDGGNIITGSITADKISVTDLSALNATIGGWSIESRRLSKGGGSDDLSRVQINAPAAPTDSSNAIAVAYRESTEDSFSTKFSVTYGGKLKCTDVNITGGDLGGATITPHSFGGITIASTGIYSGQLIVPGSNIEPLSVTAAQLADATISAAKIAASAIEETQLATNAVSAAKIAANAVTTAKTDSTIQNRLTYANNYNNATAYGTANYPTYFTAGTVTAKAGLYADTVFNFKGNTISVKHITIDGVQYNLLGY